MDWSGPSLFQESLRGVILDQILHLKVESLLVYIGWTNW